MDYYFDCAYAGEDPNFKTIPAGYINKTVCGCGLTSVAIESDEDTIIAVPNVSLVMNKLTQYNHFNKLEEDVEETFEARERFSGVILGVYAGVDVKMIYKYIDEVKKAGTPIKLIVTYDSLSKCEKFLDDCHLIIDESDKLISYMAMKVSSKRADQPMDVVTKLFKIAEKYRDTVSFISATPIDVSYLEPWVAELNQITLHWKHSNKLTPITMKRDYPFNALEEEIIRPLKKNGEIELGGCKITKVIVFINSVDSIVKIARECELSRDEVAILCGDSSRNSFKIRGYKTIDNPKKLPKYTFLTSSGFQGIDLIDKEAINVIVSYTGKHYQMVDLNTDLIQATSRQRDRSNPNFDKFIYIYDQSCFAEKTEAEIIEEMESVRTRILDTCSLLKSMKEMGFGEREYVNVAKTFLQSEDFRRYTILDESTGEFILNEIVFKSERYQILETKKRYTEGFDIIKDFLEGSCVEPINIPEAKRSRKLSYKSLMYKYRKNLIQPVVDLDDILSIFSTPSRPEVDRNKFDAEELSSKNFAIIDSYYKSYGKFSENATYARRMARVIGAEEDQFRVEIQCLFPKEHQERKTDLQDKMTEVYREYGIERKAKAVDLIEFGYEIRIKKLDGYDFVVILETPKVE